MSPRFRPRPLRQDRAARFHRPSPCSPFFSGISLDVTPQIDEDANITLHIRPSVSVVSETKVLSLGSLGTFQLPLASSNINETDSVVRVTDGNIVAIGGLMAQTQTDDSGRFRGPAMCRSSASSSNKVQGPAKARTRRVALPTVIQGDRQWRDDLEQTQQRLESMRQPAGADNGGHVSTAFWLARAAFRHPPDTAYAFSGVAHQQALNTLVVALEGGEGFVKLPGSRHRKNAAVPASHS